jgi:peptide/nickel transport system substrate-binding protein
MGKRFRTIGIVASASLLAVSCGGSSASNAEDDASRETSAPGSSPVARDSTVASGATPSTSSAEVEFDRTARFVWAARTMPRSLNPHLTPFTGGSVPALTMLHDRLTYMNPRTGEIEPMLATSWEASPDGRSIEFTLREDATYHDDGSPVDAASIVANFEYGESLGDAHPESGGYSLIESVEAVDEFVVRFNLTGNYAGGIPELMSGGLGIPVNPASFDREDHEVYDAGTGPYRVKEIRPGRTITQVPYEDYWDPEAQTIGELVITLEENEDTVVNGIATGQIDASSLAGTVAARAEASGLNVTSGLSNSAWVIFFNTERTQMQDLRVRQALNMAIDRQVISEGPLQGQCVPTVQPWNEHHRAHHPDYPGDYYQYDPERARELLAEAGFPDGISFEIDTYTINSYVPVAEVLQAQLAEAGFDVTIRQIDTAQLSPGFRTERTLDTWFTRTPFGQPPIDSISSYWLPTANNNPGGLVDEELVELYERLLGQTDPDEQAATLQEISAHLVEEPSNALIICHDVSFYVGGDDVVGLEPAAAGFMDFRNMGKATS